MNRTDPSLDLAAVRRRAEVARGYVSLSDVSVAVAMDQRPERIGAATAAALVLNEDIPALLDLVDTLAGALRDIVETAETDDIMAFRGAVVQARAALRLVGREP